MKSPPKKSLFICPAKGEPIIVAEEVEVCGVLVEETKESPGKGCLKKGTPEGNS